MQDVANHQIRNLKAILIDDTIKFERQYHLERLVKGRSRVDIYESQLWYQRVMSTMEQCHSGRHPTPTKHFEIFSCAIIEYLFDNDICSGLPSTLYLDEDRLHTIKAEIDDLICLDVCSDVFDFFLKSFQYEGDVLATIRRNLCNSLVAIMGNAMGYGIQQWIANSEALSLELLRQALKASGQTAVPNHEISAAANDHLLHALQNVKTSQRSSLKPTLVQKVGICIQRHINSTPLDLYNDLVANSSGATTSSTSSLHLFSKDASPSHGESSESIKWQDLANRISHIILLNWRVWKDIAYVPQELSSFETSHTSIAQPGLSSRPESPASRQEPSAVPTMHTGEPPESGTDSHAAREMRF